MSELDIRKGIRALISGGLGQLDNHQLAALGKAIVSEGIRRRKGLKEFENTHRFIIELENEDALLVTKNGTCAKCNKWPGSDR